MMMLLLKMYGVIIMSVLMHEIGHMVTAIIFKIKILKIQIGCEIMSFRIGKLSISPIILAGYVEVEENSLMNAKGRGIWMFFLSGMLMNFIICVSSVLIKNEFWKTWLFIFNITAVVINVIPILGKNDITTAIKCFSKYLYENRMS